VKSDLIVRVKRREGPDSEPYWEEYAVPYVPGHNVISLLMSMRENPVTRDGKHVAPIAWEASCLEEVCGSCTMLVNGRVRQSCTALVDSLERPITLEPMSKFPPVRDLIVDRSRLFGELKKVRAWIELDGTYDLGPGPRVSPDVQEYGYALSRCISCGCCLEVCPQYNDRSVFVGAAAIGQAILQNLRPSGALHKDERIEALMGEGGVSDCGNAQNCVRACPKELPLLEAIADAGRQTTTRWLKDLFWK
jgi:succinate dehydrogenase / fumarate reductase iron-sulfur subunit